MDKSELAAMKSKTRIRHKIIKVGGMAFYTTVRTDDLVGCFKVVFHFSLFICLYANASVHIIHIWNKHRDLKNKTFVNIRYFAKITK